MSGRDFFRMGRAARMVLLPVAVAAGTGLSACGGDSPTQPSTASLPQFDGVLDFTETLLVDERMRSWIVHLPDSYDHVERLPVVVAFHGAGEDAASLQAATKLDGLADSRRFIAIYPRATSRWAEDCDCNTADRQGVDDILFVRFLINEMGRRYALDKSRAFATGFSQGGFFIQRLACEPNSPVQAIATVAATMRRSLADVCDNASSLPVLLMHGTDDTSVPAEGSGDGVGGTFSVAEATGVWRSLNSCRGAPNVSFDPADPNASPRFRTELHDDCNGDNIVQIEIVEDGVHDWPAPDRNPSGLDASRVIVDFFLR